MPRVILIGLGLAAIMYVVLCIALFLVQRSFIYYPQSKSSSRAPTFTLVSGSEQVLISIRAGSSPKAVIYFGGNAEEVSQSLPTLAAAFPERSMYALNYRGYGG